MNEHLPKRMSQALIDSLPHQPPMRLIHTVIAVTANTATCETEVDDSIKALFLAANDQVDSCVGVELMAQSSAIPLIHQQDEGQEMQGMLVQVKTFEVLQSSVPVGSKLITKIELEDLENSSFVIAHGETFLGDTLICKGSITLAVQSA